MTRQDIQQNISESLPQIFAFALKRTNDRHTAEDLSQDIIVNLFSSAHSLKDPDKFHAWMWSVADNVFKSYLRKKKKYSHSEFSEEIQAPVMAPPTPDNLLVGKEQLGLLYRELSLLSGLYRESTVLYYMRGMSCEGIASRLKISQDQVKQYLFKSRKKVREGMSQIRERGEGSFNPRRFNIYHWGLSGNTRGALFRRELPGNIMLETYYEPVTVEQLSMELGVSTVYLEDEIQLLVQNDLLRLAYNNRYQANIVIFTQEFEAEMEKKTQDIYSNLAVWLHNFFLDQEEEIRALGFEGSGLSQNSLFWQLATLSLTEAGPVRLIDEINLEYPTHSDGTTGYMWGLERNYGDNNFDPGIHHYSDRKGNQIHLTDFYILGAQRYQICRKPMADLLLKLASGADLTEDDQDQLPLLIRAGYLSDTVPPRVAMPVFSAAQFAALRQILAPAEEHIYQASKELLSMTSSILTNYVPIDLRGQVPVLASLKQAEDCLVKTMNALYLNRAIELPKPSTELLTAYVVLASPAE